MKETMFLFLLIGVNCQLNPMDDPNMPSVMIAPLKPDRCNKPAEFLYMQCCVFPAFFTKEVAKECGAMTELISADKKNNITALRRIASSKCGHWKCILEKYDLLGPEDTLDDEKYYSHLERWSTLNPSFTEVMKNAKMHCKSEYRMYLPLKICEFYDIHGCIRNYVKLACPVIFPTTECTEQKQFYEECREYFI